MNFDSSEMGLDLYSYRKCQKLASNDPPFYALIAAAMRRADTQNMAKLKAMWPRVAQDLQARYDSPGGFLKEECCPDCLKAGEVKGHQDCQYPKD